MNNEYIASYGIILYTINSITGLEKGVPKYLIAQRRDSIEYVDFLRGKININNVKPELMTPDERRKILDSIDSFDVLWKDLMCKDFNKNDRSYERSKQRFENNKSNIIHLFNKYLPINNVHNPSWGFPKGRRLRSSLFLWFPDHDGKHPC